MAKLVTSGKIFLEWEDGQTVELGTVGVDWKKDGAVLNVRRAIGFRQRVGWDLIRMGFRCMMPGRQWRLKVNDQG